MSNHTNTKWQINEWSTGPTSPAHRIFADEHMKYDVVTTPDIFQEYKGQKAIYNSVIAIVPRRPDGLGSGNAQLIAQAPAMYDVLHELLLLACKLEVCIDGEFASCRSVHQLAEDGDLSPEIIEAQAVLAAINTEEGKHE